ncbi:ATP-grasp domain-containing protein [Lentzea sp. NPDC054927]
MTTTDVAILDRGIPYLEMRELMEKLEALGAKTTYAEYHDVVFEASDTPLLHQGAPLDAKVVLVRSRFFSRISEVASVFDSLALLENAGVAVVNNPGGIQKSHNKVLSVDILRRAGLRVPDTRLIRTLEQGADCLRTWTDVVVKPVHGIASTDNVLLRDIPEMRSPDTPGELSLGHEIQLSYLLRVHESMCAQRYVPNTGRDVRVMYIDGRVVSAYRRKTFHAPPTEQTRKNPQHVEAVEVTPELEKTVVTAATTLNLAHACVDFVEGHDGELTIVEVNPTISLWRHVDDEGMHLTEHGVGAAFADMLVARLG